MDRKKEEFLGRLRETFRVEAAEHLEVIAAGIVAMEHADDAELAAIVERVFREAHSLKGAARSVSLPEAEALCTELESIFSAMQRKAIASSKDMFDVIHVSIGVLSTLCLNPGAPLPLEIDEKLKQALAAIRRVIPEASDMRVSAPVAAAPTIAKPSPGINPIGIKTVVSIAAESVRVPTRKLGAILLEAEELVGARIVANARAAELRALAADLADWNQRRVHRTARSRRSGETITVSELLDTEAHYTKTLEGSLKKLAGSTQQDALSLAAITDRLLEDAKKLVLMPCSYLFGHLSMVVHDLAGEQGKEVDLLVRGEDIEIDRRVLDELKDPFNHLLRNCVDHGIEKPEARKQHGKPSRGSITITARSIEGNRVELTVADDGSGIDSGKIKEAAVRLGMMDAYEARRMNEADAHKLIFRSGLSTSRIITDMSGRGLGLAIVREKVEKLGGAISVSSIPGDGTVFRLLVPSSLATFRGVLVEVAGGNFVIPTANVARVGRVKPDDISKVENRRMLSLDQGPVSLARLRDVLELSGPDRNGNGETLPVVLVRAAGRQIAFIVDGIQGEREVMVKSLGGHLARVRNVAGATIASSGAVVPILNAADLVESAITLGEPAPLDDKSGVEVERRGRLLVAEDSITARTMLKGILEGAGYDVKTAVDGIDALTELKTESFDLLVSDVDMPRMNGFELTSRVRADKKLHELPVVLVTALGSAKDREYGIEVGANAYIVKSDFDQGNLLEIIRRFL
ncbi:MAG TPA: response regulator [bacterium]|nr:response regulator [bacterium]